MLIVNENSMSDNPVSERYKVRQPQLSSIVGLTQSSKLFGLTERVVGVESLIFLGHQYECLRPYLEHLTSANSQQEQGFLHQFYTQTIASAVELRKPIFMAVTAQAFDVATVLNLMNKVNWEVRDVMSQHSSYIDTLMMVKYGVRYSRNFFLSPTQVSFRNSKWPLQEMQTMHSRMEEIANVVPLSPQVRAAIWENAAHLITHTLVEGYVLCVLSKYSI